MQQRSTAPPSRSSNRRARHSQQISIRLLPETVSWLEKRSGGGRRKAEFVRGLIEDAMAREREQSLLAMFNQAAAELTTEDREERDALVGAFADSE